MKLAETEIRFEPASWGDPNGRLFHWQDGLYRGVTAAMSPLYRDLLRNLHVGELFDRGLIETELTDARLDGYELVLRHRRVPHISYGFEWCEAMLRDAALLTINLNLALAEFGCELQDANPWNVLFDGCRPVWVDFGSIVPSRPGPWRAFPEFVKSFLNPLFLLGSGLAGETREAMMDHTRWGVTDQGMARLVPARRRFGWWINAVRRNRLAKLDRVTALRRLRDMLADIAPASATTEWSGYYDDYCSLDDRTDWTPKQLHAAELLDCGPTTVLDVACNGGWFSKLAARNGHRVTAFDCDATCIHGLYAEASREQLPILPLVMDFARPSEAYGPSGQYPEAGERFRSDIVLALALVHHLVFGQHMTFGEIVAGLSRFTEKTLLVEFVPRDDRCLVTWNTAGAEWYTLENFVNALRAEFPRVEVMESNREPRKLMRCQREW